MTDTTQKRRLTDMSLPAEPLTWPDEMEALRAENEALRAAGGRMANALHNLAQIKPNEHFPAALIERLNDMRIDWNEAAKPR